MRQRNNPSSARSKAPGKPLAVDCGLAAGDLVFIKDERDKAKVRDRYIIISIDKRNASLQKLTDKFMSKKYVVPLARLYPASTPPSRTPPSEGAEEDSDEDYESFAQNPMDDTDNIDNNDDDSSDSEPEQEVPPAPPTPPARPGRVRQPPAWIRGGEYDMASDE